MESSSGAGIAPYELDAQAVATKEQIQPTQETRPNHRPLPSRTKTECFRSSVSEGDAFMQCRGDIAYSAPAQRPTEGGATAPARQAWPCPWRALCPAPMEGPRAHPSLHP